MSDTNDNKIQNVFLYSRNKVNVTGIVSVDSFDENGIAATTFDGDRLYIEGNGITITDVNLEEGCFEASGNINGVYYSSIQNKTSGIFGRFFRAR